MKDNVIQRKSFEFAVKIVNLTRELRRRKIEVSMVDQLQRSGTSVSANVEEAIASISKKEFSAKLSISYKEIRETKNWIKVLYETKSIRESEYREILDDCDEIARILFAILRTTRINAKK